MDHSNCIYAVVAIFRLGQEVLVTFDVNIKVVVRARNAADDIPSPTIINFKLVSNRRSSNTCTVATRLDRDDGVVDCSLKSTIYACSFRANQCKECSIGCVDWILDEHVALGRKCLINSCHACVYIGVHSKSEKTLVPLLDD